ncbi:MAG TPA: serine/threonine-protein kinase, partial [Chthoniobacteraceae bacterium]
PEPLSFPKRKYDVGRLVATGGMGAIIDTFETATERRVAMKIMADPARTDYRRFLLEARITAKLEHPNIVPLHELAINEEGRPYYTMKLVQGVSLRKVFELLVEQDSDAIQNYSLDALLTIFQKVCDAVAFAHSKGVLHRDLKPDNIMLGQFGEALVMDWGLAKVLGVPDLVPAAGERVATASPPGSDSSLDKTLEGEVLGTPNYMSPEQARGEIERLDPRTDIYSLGAILYHYLTLEPPVSGKTVHEVLANACIGQIERPIKALGEKKLRHLPSGRVPESLDAVVMKALSLDPDQRYSSVIDLQREIRAYQTGFATAAERAGAWRLFKLFFIRHLALSSAISLVLVCGAIFLGYMIYEKNVADTQRDTAEARLYLSHMAQVRDDIDDGRPQTAHELLALHLHERTGKDLRGWEWYNALGQLNDDELRVTKSHRNGAFSLAASPDGSLLASGGADGDIAIWKTQGLESENRFHAHDDAVFAVAWSSAGNLLASGGGKGMVRIWNAKTGQKLAEVLSPAGQPVRALSWNCANPEDPILVFGGPFSDVFLWKPLASGEDAKPKTIYKTKEGVSGLCWSANGAYLALTRADQSDGLEVIGPEGEPVLTSARLGRVGSDLSAVAIDPHNRYVAIGTRHRTVSVFEILTGKKIFSLALHTGLVNALAWSPDGQQLASVGDDCAVRIVSPFAAPAPGGYRPVTRFFSAYPRALNAVVWANLPGN